MPKARASSYLRSKGFPLRSIEHNPSMEALKSFGLFVATALAEIVGCYLPYLWVRQGKTAWLLLPAAVSLALFAWLLTLHPTAAGRRPRLRCLWWCVYRRRNSLALGC